MRRLKLHLTLGNEFITGPESVLEVFGGDGGYGGQGEYDSKDKPGAAGGTANLTIDAGGELSVKESTWNVSGGIGGNGCSVPCD